MKYLAHIEGEREQTIKEHSIGTAELAAMFAKAFGKDDWGYCVGMLHDIGKYSERFQKKIQGDNNIKVDHSTAGAKVCYEMGGLYGILSYCIAGHHAGLPNTGTISGLDKSSLFGRLKKGVDDFSRYKDEINIPCLKTFPFNPQKTVTPDFSLSVFIRMMYSCLVLSLIHI